MLNILNITLSEAWRKIEQEVAFLLGDEGRKNV
jgi:hypothetical protein